jgi:hypothetical protein
MKLDTETDSTNVLINIEMIDDLIGKRVLLDQHNDNSFREEDSELYGLLLIYWTFGGNGYQQYKKNIEFHPDRSDIITSVSKTVENLISQTWFKKIADKIENEQKIRRPLFETMEAIIQDKFSEIDELSLKMVGVSAQITKGHIDYQTAWRNIMLEIYWRTGGSAYYHYRPKNTINPNIIEFVIKSLPELNEEYGVIFTKGDTQKQVEQENGEQENRKAQQAKILIKSFPSIKNYFIPDYEKFLVESSYSQGILRDIKKFGINIPDADFDSILFILKIARDLLGDSYSSIIVEKEKKEKEEEKTKFLTKRYQSVDFFSSFMSEEESWTGRKTRLNKNVSVLGEITNSKGLNGYKLIVQGAAKGCKATINITEDYRDLLQILLNKQKEETDNMDISKTIVKSMAKRVYSYINILPLSNNDKYVPLSNNDKYVLTGYMLMHLGLMPTKNDWLKVHGKSFEKEVYLIKWKEGVLKNKKEKIDQDLKDYRIQLGDRKSKLGRATIDELVEKKRQELDKKLLDWQKSKENEFNNIIEQLKISEYKEYREHLRADTISIMKIKGATSKDELNEEAPK